MNKKSFILSGIVCLELFAAAKSAQAGTLAYWRFENGPDSSAVAHGAGDGYPNYAADVVDSSGSGNALSMWATGGGASFTYDNDVPFSTVLQTGASNNFSLQNAGSFPASYSQPGSAFTTQALSAWTVEVSWKPENGGFRTVVGRDAQNVSNGDANLAGFYLGATPGNALHVLFTDEAGFTHEAITADGFISGFNYGGDPEGLLGTWYNIAASSNGTTLSLFSNGVLVASKDLTLSGSTNTALTDGLNGAPGGADVAGGGDWGAGSWTVGRGLYAGGHTDRAYGLIDEVRISDTALAPNQLLANTPEPVTGVMLLGGMGMLGLLRRRR